MYISLAHLLAKQKNQSIIAAWTRKQHPKSKIKSDFSEKSKSEMNQLLINNISNVWHFSKLYLNTEKIKKMYAIGQ